MKNFFKKTMVLLILLSVLTPLGFPSAVSAVEGDLIVLFTNDVHCSTEDYALLAAYRAELIARGHTVVTVDAGDHIQGELIGPFTNGYAIIEMMNAVGYDMAVPGNHEFDYGMDTYLELAASAEFSYLSCNFTDLRTESTVFDAYEIVEFAGEKLAFVGITTPECYTKSTPAYFQDENGELIYGFGADALNELYDTVQNAVDSARSAGAERVIAISHLGIDGVTEGWKSTDVISNTEGIDVFLDGHSHEIIENAVYKNKNTEDVVLSSTGTKLQYIGCLTIKENTVMDTELIDTDSLDVNDMSASAREAYNTVKKIDDDYQSQLSYVYEVLGSSEVELSLNDAEGNWVIRTNETNMGNFVADAYRAVSGADISFVNGGGIRASIAAGDVTRKMLMDVNPWNNEMCVIRATGRQIMDALEHGASRYPESNGGFLHVSGMSYEMRSDVESPVVFDSMGMFLKVDETKERRVLNIKVAGQPIESDATYTIAGNYYMLQQGGDGFSMFAEAEVLEREGLPTDAQMLEKYFSEHLNGVITEEQYGDISGDGRIKVVTAKDLLPAMGDVNGDGKVNPFDASLILRYDAMIITKLDYIAVADVSGDNKVNPFDASLILRFDAMLIQKFPCEE